LLPGLTFTFLAGLLFTGQGSALRLAQQHLRGLIQKSRVVGTGLRLHEGLQLEKVGCRLRQTAGSIFALSVQEGLEQSHLLRETISLGIILLQEVGQLKHTL
jgi:hypothetical protein